ncbi:MAG: Mrp/NBP35 family ATP-binding protein [Paracoccaceae bacterium]|nr:Mrp/NBP35 family ATP-binding protein [Paracoccaceae bacterium]MDE2675955.1 Mrp/NBP35 family ATP-binding protein [Paracoccaceae bacterium]
MSVTKETILNELARITIPEGNIVDLNMVKALVIDQGNVSFVLEVPPDKGKRMEPVRESTVRILEQLPGVDKVSVVMTAHSEKVSKPAAKGPPPDLKLGGHPRQETNLTNLEGVRKIVAVASGKGGVGKSTVSLNLAVSLAKLGYKVGLLDADIHGPSLPIMTGMSSKPYSPDGKTIIPLEVFGIKVMSIGFLLPKEEAVIWRGPMLMGALQQMMQQVKWGQLDIILVDLPPGTGDVQLTLCQRFPLTGAIIVCTPQDLALADARRAITMFQKLNSPILGIVENMSYYLCPKCNNKDFVFGRNGARQEAQKLGVPFLGEIPLEMSIRKGGDDGNPIALNHGETADVFALIGELII